MPLPPRVKDRLFTLLCFACAALVLVVGFSRGNTKVALGGAAVFVGYAVLHSVARRLTPGARMLMGSEADAQERMVQFKATRLAGQMALCLAILGVAISVLWDWAAGLWIAGACGVVVMTFIGGLWHFTRAARSGRSVGGSGQSVGG